MAVYKEEKTNTWKVYYRYTDWQGKRKQTTKRGFATKREAQAWEREQLCKTQADLDMTFGSFVDTYTVDMKNRVKENTWHTKEHIIRTKILPYFEKRKINEIQPKDIIAWQNEMIKSKDKRGKAYSPVVPFPVSWTVKMKKKQKETQDILSYHTQAAGCSDKARAKASGGRQPIEECGRTGL